MLPTNRAAIFGSLLRNAATKAASGLLWIAAFAQLALAALVWVRKNATASAGRAAGLSVAKNSLSRQPRHRQAQAGQIMAPAVVLLLISSGLFYLMVNSGQAVNEKTRVTNAADAAAYSAGVVEARALNYYAYTNRAMVANQVVIAQMVSFASWARYFASASRGITRADVVRDTTFLVQFSLDLTALYLGFTAAQSAIETAAVSVDAAAAAVQAASGLGITAADLATNALAGSQQAVALNLRGAARQSQIANDVVRDMDPALQAQVVDPLNLPPVRHEFDQFTRSYTRNSGSSSSDERGRLADVVVRSRDDFSRERSWNIRPDALRTIFGVRRNGELRRRGGTDLVGFDEWRSVDTLELHGEYFGSEPRVDGSRRNCRRRIGFIRIPWWCGDIQKEVGSAAMNVNAGGGDAGRGVHGQAYRDNPRSATNAERGMLEPQPYQYSGIPSSREIQDLGASTEQTTGITVMVSKQHGSMLTSGGSAQARPSGQLALFNDRPNGGRMIALSRAQVFFDRLNIRAGNRIELASLYNPYWRVRIVPPRAIDRTFAAGQQGGMFLP
jgi:hypothetical protein